MAPRIASPTIAQVGANVIPAQSEALEPDQMVAAAPATMRTTSPMIVGQSHRLRGGWLASSTLARDSSDRSLEDAKKKTESRPPSSAARSAKRQCPACA